MRLTLDRDRVEPGHVVRGTIRDPGFGLFTLELYWETSGKGDSDRTVVHRAELSANNAHLPFAVQAPLLPLTYNGTLIKIAWFVRVFSGAAGGARDMALPFEIAPRR